MTTQKLIARHNSVKTKEEKTINNKLIQNMDEDEIRESDVKKEEYQLYDAVLVRCFSRKKWTYYIGFIEKIFQKTTKPNTHLIS